MSKIRSRTSEKTESNSMKDAVGRPVMQAIRMAREESDAMRSTESQDGKIVRSFLLIDVGAALDYFRSRRGGRGATSEATEALTEMVPEPEVEEESGGRGILSRMFVLGLVVGVGYMLRRRSGSGGQVTGKVTERAESVADETVDSTHEAAERTSSVTGMVAERLQQGGEMAADRIQMGSERLADTIQQEGGEAAGRVETGTEQAAERVETSGEEAAERIDEAAETAEEAEQKATESMGEGSESGGEGEQSSESGEASQSGEETEE